MSFVKEQFKETDKEWVLLACIGASSGVGRLAFGKIGDLVPGLQKIYMQVRMERRGPHIRTEGRTEHHTEAAEPVLQVVQLHRHFKKSIIIYRYFFHGVWWLQHELGLFTAL
jgi:hypothetical protein